MLSVTKLNKKIKWIFATPILLSKINAAIIFYMNFPNKGIFKWLSPGLNAHFLGKTDGFVAHKLILLQKALDLLLDSQKVLTFSRGLLSTAKLGLGGCLTISDSLFIFVHNCCIVMFCQKMHFLHCSKSSHCSSFSIIITLGALQEYTI